MAQKAKTLIDKHEKITLIYILKTASVILHACNDNDGYSGKGESRDCCTTNYAKSVILSFSVRAYIRNINWKLLDKFNSLKHIHTSRKNFKYTCGIFKRLTSPYY